MISDPKNLVSYKRQSSLGTPVTKGRVGSVCHSFAGVCISPYKSVCIIGRYVPSQADVAVFEAVSGPPPADLCHALRWYNHIKSYEKEKAR